MEVLWDRMHLKSRGRMHNKALESVPCMMTTSRHVTAQRPQGGTVDYSKCLLQGGPISTNSVIHRSGLWALPHAPPPEVRGTHVYCLLRLILSLVEAVDIHLRPLLGSELPSPPEGWGGVHWYHGFS